MSRRNRGSRPPKRERELIRKIEAKHQADQRAATMRPLGFALKVAVVDLMTDAPMQLLPEVPADHPPSELFPGEPMADRLVFA